MDSDRTVLLVGATDDTVRKAKDLGLHILLLQHPTKLTEEQERLVDVLHVLDYPDWAATEPVVRKLWQAPGFAVATSLTEPGLEGAGRINDVYGLGGTSYAVAQRLRDKWTMRRHLAAHDPTAVAAASLTDRRAMVEFGDRHGYPFIVKPVDGTASYGVFRVDGAADIDGVWEQVRQLRGRRTDRGTTLFQIEDFLMEEFIDGPEFSVESFSFAGRHVIVAITEKFVDSDSFAELGHVVPARIDEATEERMRACVTRFLDAIGMADGTCHTELRIGPRGPAVIESHNRIGGDAIPDLVRGAYGIDLSTYALAWPFGLVDQLPDRPEPKCSASSRFLISEPGRVESVDGAEEARRLPDVLEVRISARPGDSIRPLRDNWDRLGLVAVTAADGAAAVRRCGEVIEETIRIRVRGDDGVVRSARVAPATGAASYARGSA